MLRFFEKKRFLVDIKANYFLMETKVWGVETEWCRLGDVIKGTETVLRGPEVILQI